MHFEFEGRIFTWRGPSPYLFVAMPDDASRDLKVIAGLVTYGWGVIPVKVRLGQTTWTTSLFPKDGRYLVPIKVMVQKAEHVTDGDLVSLQLDINK